MRHATREAQAKWPDPHGYFGEFGGRFVPETLVTPLLELEEAFSQAGSPSSLHESWRACCETTRVERHPCFVRRGSPRSLGAGNST